MVMVDEYAYEAVEEPTGTSGTISQKIRFQAWLLKNQAPG